MIEMSETQNDVREIPIKIWLAEGEKLFGKDEKDWKFVCPNCGHIQSGKDFIELNKKGISDIKASTVVYFSCIGRFDTRIPEDKIGTIYDKKKKRPCNYTNGGLFNFAKTIVVDENGKRTSVFEFARGKKNG